MRRWRSDTAKKGLKRYIIVLYVFFLIASATLAKKLSVEKLVEKPDEVYIDRGVKILLRISNPFNKPVKIEIRDKNIIGQNGLDIQCLEYVLPNKPEVILAYEDIIPYKEGKYVLEPAEITYINPNTGNRDTVKSNSLELTVKKGNTTGTLRRTGITTIYKCRGQSIRTTSFSSGGMQISINNRQINQQPAANPQTMQDRIGRSQQSLNQNTAAIKRQMEQREKELSQQRKALGDKIEQSKQFRKLSQSLEEQGYRVVSREINPENNSTGDFKYIYTNGSHTGIISGRIENNKIKQISRISEQEKNNMKKRIESDSRFKEFQQQLKADGYKIYDKKVELNPDLSGSFRYTYKKASKTGIISGKLDKGKISEISKHNPDDFDRLKRIIENNSEVKKLMDKLQGKNYVLAGKKFTPIANNVSHFTYKYVRNNTNETAIIEGDVNLNGKIKNLRVKYDRKNYLPELLFTIVLTAVIYILYKYIKKKQVREIVPPVNYNKKQKKSIDYRREAISMLKRARDLFDTGREKEAYMLISMAIRNYYKGYLKIKSEMTNKQLIKELRKRNLSSRNVKKCLNLCSLVEFAKYHPKKEDFFQTIKLAEDIIL